MQVSDEQLEAMCRAYQDNPGPFPWRSWESISPRYQESARSDMRAALAVLPELAANKDCCDRRIEAEREREQRSAELATLRTQHEWLQVHASMVVALFPRNSDNPAVRRLRDRLLKGAPAPEQPASAERPASLREVWAELDLHERILRELARALEGSTATLHHAVREALRALDARKAGGR